MATRLQITSTRHQAPGQAYNKFTLKENEEWMKCFFVFEEWRILNTVWVLNTLNKWCLAKRVWAFWWQGKCNMKGNTNIVWIGNMIYWRDTSLKNVILITKKALDTGKPFRSFDMAWSRMFSKFVYCSITLCFILNILYGALQMGWLRGSI